MATIHEQISEQFHRWEHRLRGERFWGEPVSIEPPFVPFTGYVFPKEYVDDGRKPTVISSLFHSFWGRAEVPRSEPDPYETDPEPQTLNHNR